MSKPRALALALPLLLIAGAAAAQPRAGACVIGPGLASTLLIPYVEVDLAHPFNVTTLLSLNNGLGDAALARVVLWTDWGIPTLAFDVYLDGFDVQTINLRDLFSGNVPSTGDGANLSGFAGCDVNPPSHPNPALSVSQQSQLAAYHTGVGGPLDAHCAGQDHGDQIARGYLTVDVVHACNGIEGPVAPVHTPADTATPYFDDGADGGTALDTNRLWGDVLYVDTDNAAAQGNEAVALWADPTLFNDTAIYTFYGRFTGWDGRDDRVPLPYLWDQRFVNGGPFAGGADLIVWRDTEEADPAPIDCGGEPAWYPLLTSTNIALDESAGNLMDFGTDKFPLATQRVDVGALGIPYSFGLIQIGTAPGQSWVQPTLGAAGLYSASWNGTPVEFTCGPHQ